MIYLILNKEAGHIISLFNVQTLKFMYMIIHSGWILAPSMNIHEGKFYCRVLY